MEWSGFIGFFKGFCAGQSDQPARCEQDLLVADFHELNLLEQVLAQESQEGTAYELAVTARGVAKAAEILAGQFTLVATNVPYLGRPKQKMRCWTTASASIQPRKRC